MSDEETKKRIGNMVLEFRTRSGYSMEQLGSKVGCSRQMIGMIESGSKSPSFKLATRLSDVMHLPLSTLTGKPDTVEKLFNAIDLYESTEKYAGNGLPSYMKLYSITGLKDKYGKRISYKLDDGIADIPSIDLYAIRLNEFNKALGAPKGSYVIVQYKDVVLDFSRPFYAVIDFDFVPKSSDDIFNGDGKIKLHHEFITKITALKNMNESINVDSKNPKYIQYFKFSFPDGNEYYADEATIKKAVKGLVKKVIIDF